MSSVPPEPRIWLKPQASEEIQADLRRQIGAVKARLEEHRTIMRLAGLTVAAEPKGSEPSD